MEHITAKEYQTYFKKEKRGTKYNNKKTIIDNKKFDSASEGDLYFDLKMQERQGLIKSVECQKKEELWAYGRHICDHYVDFYVEHLDGTFEYIEHKGIATAEYQIKKKMLLAKYDQEIKDGKIKYSINWYRQKYNKNLLKPYRVK